MSTIATAGRAIPARTRNTPNFAAKVLVLAAILAIAAAFVLKYVFRYYLHYNQVAFTNPNQAQPTTGSCGAGC
jgi:hypothetical protein